jgi:hypothetical protein
MEIGWPRGNRPAPIRKWEVSKNASRMLCEINQHPLGWEIRFSYRGEFYRSQVHWTLELAEAEVENVGCLASSFFLRTAVIYPRSEAIFPTVSP